MNLASPAIPFSTNPQQSEIYTSQSERSCTETLVAAKCLTVPNAPVRHGQLNITGRSTSRERLHNPRTATTFEFALSAADVFAPTDGLYIAIEMIERAQTESHSCQSLQNQNQPQHTGSIRTSPDWSPKTGNPNPVNTSGYPRHVYKRQN